MVKLFNQVPMPTWGASLPDVYRKCSFCPADEKVAPDTYQKMNKSIIDKIHDQLLEINYLNNFQDMASHFYTKILTT